MAKLVIGTSKQTVIPAVVRDKSPEIYRVFRVNNSTDRLENSISTPFMPLPSSVKKIDDYLLYHCYIGTPASVLSGLVDLSSLIDFSGTYCCAGMFCFCNGITRVDLSNLTTVSGSYACSGMFQECTGITNVDLSSFTTVSGQSGCTRMFDNCTSLTNIDLDVLTTISAQYGCSYMFEKCTGLTNVILKSLTDISGAGACQYMFQQCSNLTNLSFPAIKNSSFGVKKNQFSSMLTSVTGCTIHFPSNLDPQGGSTVLSGLTGYPTFGGTNTVLAFDLPATNLLTGANTTVYERSPKYDTQTALAWRVNEMAVNTTTYYTSGTTDPQVNGTIYSDSACTIAVTTISSIA